MDRLTPTPVFTLGAAYVPSLQSALRQAQDAHTCLLGRDRVGDAMGCTGRTVQALYRFLRPLKVI